MSGACPLYPRKRTFALVCGCPLKAKSGDCLASLEPDPNPLPLTGFDSSPLHPALWYGRKRAKINLAVGGFQIVSNVATLSVQKAVEGCSTGQLVFHQRVQE